MSCPDWLRLLTVRESLGGTDPAGWQDALEHLESCSACRREALRREPLLALRHLPEPALEPDEGRRMVAAVRALGRQQAAGRRWRHRAAAAVAVVAVGAVLAGGSLLLERSGAGSVESGAADVSSLRSGPDLPPASGTGPDATSVGGAVPSVLDLEQAAARVYEVSDAGLAIVVVVDQGFDLEG